MQRLFRITTTFIVLLVCCLILANAEGCRSDENVANEITKDQAQKTDKTDWPSDYCEESGWYGDSVCDDFCPEIDPDCVQQQCVTISGNWIFTEHCMEELKDEVAIITQTNCDITISYDNGELFTGYFSEANIVKLISDSNSCEATLSNDDTVITSDCNGCKIVLTKQEEELECGGPDYKLCEDQDTYCQVEDDRDDQSNGICVPFGQTCGGWAPETCDEEGQWCDVSDMAPDKGGYCLPIGGCATSDECDEQVELDLISKPCDGQWACMAGLCEMPDCNQDTCIDISGIWVFTEHCMEELKDEVANIEQTTCDITLSHNGNELFTGHVSEENRVTLISDDIACGATLSNNNTVLTSDCNGCDIVLTKQDI